jgi:hypothetical protein
MYERYQTTTEGTSSLSYVYVIFKKMIKADEIQLVSDPLAIYGQYYNRTRMC